LATSNIWARIKSALASIGGVLIALGIVGAIGYGIYSGVADLFKPAPPPPPVTSRDGDGNSRLMTAVRKNHTLDEVTQLIAAGVPINARNKSGETALILAARYCRDPSVIMALLRAGADAKAADKDRYTAVHYAMKNFSIAESQALLAIEAAKGYIALSERDNHLLDLAATGTGDEVHAAIDQGADVNTHDVEGNTPLIIAAAHGKHHHVLDVLLAAGADIDAKNDAGQTALIAGIFNRSEYSKIVTTLLESGADATIEDAQRQRAIDYIGDDDDLKGTDLYWRLSDATYGVRSPQK
jgi:uncharacterized protein